jgi:hypothetical protein
MPIPFVWSNDDISVGLTEPLERQIKFIERFGIKGVFFVVPKSGDKTIADDTTLLKAIEKARNNGHEFYQHGYIHTPFESGVPELWMLDLAPAVRRDYDVKRHEIEASHELDRMIEMIDKGRRIWRQAFGEDSAGYRPGWGAYCKNLYRALNTLGFDWISARIPSPTSWVWAGAKWEYPIEYREELPIDPYATEGRLIEFPMAGDYAFNVPNEPARIEQFVDLGMHDLAHHVKHNVPFVMVSHFHGLARNNDAGYAVHEKLLPKIIDSGDVELTSMVPLMERYRGLQAVGA